MNTTQWDSDRENCTHRDSQTNACTLKGNPYYVVLKAGVNSCKEVTCAGCLEVKPDQPHDSLFDVFDEPLTENESGAVADIFDVFGDV